MRGEGLSFPESDVAECAAVGAVDIADVEYFLSDVVFVDGAVQDAFDTQCESCVVQA
jgi:hypothetical protein